jgi:hypothetical protein
MYEDIKNTMAIAARIIDRPMRIKRMSTAAAMNMTPSMNSLKCSMGFVSCIVSWYSRRIDLLGLLVSYTHGLKRETKGTNEQETIRTK